jgi:hypothetical protein
MSNQPVQLTKLAADTVVQIISVLPLEQRVCVFYHYHDKMSVEEIASQLAITADEVKARIDAAQDKIREELAQNEEDENFKPLIGIPISMLLAPAVKYGIESGVLNITASAATAAPVAATATITAAPATSAGTAATSTIVKTTVISTKAIIAGVVACVVVTGGIVGGLMLFSGNDSPEPPEERDRPRSTSTAAPNNPNIPFDPNAPFDPDALFDYTDMTNPNNPFNPSSPWYSEETVSGRYTLTMEIDGLDMTEMLGGFDLFSQYYFEFDGNMLTLGAMGTTAANVPYVIVNDRILLGGEEIEALEILINPERTRITTRIAIPGFEDIPGAQAVYVLR